MEQEFVPKKSKPGRHRAEWTSVTWINASGDSITVESDNAAACKLVFNSNVVAPRQWREKK